MILHTNKMLFKMNITLDSKKVERLMFACTYTNFFWIRIKKWLEGFQIMKIEHIFYHTLKGYNR